MKINSLQGSGIARVSNDFYPTPDNAVLELLKRERFQGEVWEPACGDGSICKILLAAGYSVRATDLYDRGYGEYGIDFLKSLDKTDNIITNPPYNIALEFIQHSLNVASGKVVMLLKLNFLGGQKRYSKLYKVNPPSRIYVFSKRLNFDRGEDKAKSSGGLLEYAWFVWDKGYAGPTIINWI